MISYPLTFTAKAQTNQGAKSDWSSFAAQKDFENSTGELQCGIPTDFGGSGTGSSPEDFFILALMNCYVATFKVIAARMKIEYESLSANAELRLDKDADGQPWMTSAALRFDLHGAKDADRALRIMNQVSKQCMIINSVKTDVTFDLHVNERL